MPEQAPWPFPDFRSKVQAVEKAHPSDCRCKRCEHDREMDEMGEVAVAELKEKPMDGLIGLPVVDAMPERPRPRAALEGGASSLPQDGPGMVRAAVAAAHAQATAEITRLRAALARMELEQGVLRSELAAQQRQHHALADWLTADAFGPRS
jgi:hypothetical protein